MKFTILQKEAVRDALVHGELKRDSAHGDFSPGKHVGQTIKSLINKGIFEVVDKSMYGWPMTVKPTPLANWDDL